MGRAAVRLLEVTCYNLLLGPIISVTFLEQTGDSAVAAVQNQSVTSCPLAVRLSKKLALCCPNGRLDEDWAIDASLADRKAAERIGLSNSVARPVLDLR